MTAALLRRRRTGAGSSFGYRAANGYTPDLVSDFVRGRYAKAEKVLGPELVTNGDFGTGDFTGWTDAGTVNTKSVTSGQAVVDAAAYGGIYGTITTTVGTLYKAQFEGVSSDGSSILLTKADNAALSSNQKQAATLADPAGTHSFLFFATATTTYIAVRNSNVAQEFTFDNISVREITSYRPQRCDFDELYTHAATELSTMTDATGNVKWGPHNLLTYSEDFSNAAWSKVSTTASSDEIEAATTGIYRYVHHTPSLDTNTTWTLEVDAKAGTTDFIWLLGQTSGDCFGVFDLASGTYDGIGGFPRAPDSGSITALDDGWYRCKITFKKTTASGAEQIGFGVSDDGSETATAGANVSVRRASFYRSDLGGMAQVPSYARGLSTCATYTPTTSAAVYLPRLDHHKWDGSAWVNKGLLIESEARTNLATYSDAPSNFLSDNLTVTDSQIDSPLGDTTAATFIPDATNSYHRCYSIGGTSAGNDVVYSCFAKAAGYSQIAFRESASTGASAVFDLSNGTLDGTHDAGNLSVGDTYIENFGNGWYRISVLLNDAATTSINMGIHVLDGSWTSGDVISTSFAGDTTSGVYVAGIQSEEGSTPSSYKPTNGSTFAGAAETLTIASANLPWQTSETPTGITIRQKGEFDHLDEAYDATFASWTIDANNRMVLSSDGTGANTGRLAVILGDTAGTDLVFGTDGAYAVGIGTPYNLAARFSETSFNGAESGTSYTEGTSITALPDLTSTNMLVGSDFMGTIEAHDIWGVNTGDDGIEESTT